MRGRRRGRTTRGGRHPRRVPVRDRGGYKRDEHDPVTEHDRRAEQRIRAHLLRRVPGGTVVGEEDGTVNGTGGGGTVNGTGGGSDVRWYVDPIDGTANFAHRVAFFCTSIGAVSGEKVVAAAILDPIAGHLFTASPGGAYLDGRPPRSSSSPRPEAPTARCRSTTARRSWDSPGYLAHTSSLTPHTLSQMVTTLARA